MPPVNPTRPVSGTSTTSNANALPAFPANADAQQLKTLLTDTFPKLVTGRTPTINVTEAKWLMKLAALPGADASVKALLEEKCRGVTLTKAAKTAGLEALLTSLRPAAPTGNTGGTGTGTVTTPGGGNRPVGTGGVGTGGSVMDLRLGVAPTDIVPQFKGVATFDGPWKLKSAALADAYKGVKADKFGTTDVQLPGGGAFNVRDFHYDLGGGKVGMRFVAVGDDTTVKTADGKTVPGHQQMDDFLRKEMGLGADDPIFALIGYIHPEGHTGTLKELAGTLLKTEGGNTHLGAYVGGGRTTNSPETYHQNQWEVAGYPANVQMVSLEGVPQKTLNQNALIADAILNKGVQFPPDYKNDFYKTIDLKTTLDFYKRWVRDDPELKSNPKWHTYCAEHKTIVTNIMLNVPHNEAAFKEIWGDAEGKKLFGEVQAKYKAATGKDMPETSFEPLWKKEGIQNPVNEAGFGKGLAWPAETTPDIMNDFMNVYANFKDVGGVTTCAMLAGFLEVLKERTGVTAEQYFKLALPVMNKVMIAEAKTQNIASPADLQKFMQQSAAALYVGLGGKKEDFAPGGTINPQTMGLAQNMLKGVEAQAPDILQNHGITKDQARGWLDKALLPDLEAARTTPIGDPNKPRYFSPPNITHRVAIGLHEHSKFVTVKTLCTAVDHTEVEPK
ncbi:MAG: hypothetical protein HY904_25870 [Deltaproteobacteria bacterium]|nr:hypothetical protein [Deltaproteobacteria bacterium]